MYIRLSSLLPVAVLAAAVTAAPSELAARQSQCNTGSLQCCQVVTAASNPASTLILGLLGIVLQDLTQLVGLGCSPIQALTSTSCTDQPICCNNNNFGGLISIGCSPINVGL